MDDAKLTATYEGINRMQPNVIVRDVLAVYAPNHITVGQ